jgi:hypothetical protein
MRHEELRKTVENAINCASNLRPGGPFFVAADVPEALPIAADYGHRRNVTIAHNPWNASKGLHVESFYLNEDFTYLYTS